MKNFKYRATDHNKRIHTGVISAENFEDLLYKLYQKKLYPLEVETVSKTDDKLHHLKRLQNKLALKPDDSDTPKMPTEESSNPILKTFKRLDLTYLIIVLSGFGFILLSMYIGI